MIVKQMLVRDMLKIFKELSKNGFEYCDMETFNNINRDSIRIITNDNYKKQNKIAKIKLTESIINKIIA